MGAAAHSTGHPVFEEAHRALDAVSSLLEGCARDDLGPLVAGVRAVRAHVDRVSVAITRRAEELSPASGPGRSSQALWEKDHGAGDDHDAAGDDPSDDSATGAPPPDPDEARREADRARVCALLPRVAEAFEAGKVSGAHLDVLARVTARRDRTLLDLFCSSDHDIAHHAATTTPHGLRLWCQELIIRCQAQLGRDLDDRQRRDTRLRWNTDAQTGMVRLHGQFHPELGHQITHALDAQIATLKNTTQPGAMDVPGIGGPHPHETTNRDHLAAWALAHLLLHTTGATRRAGVELAIVIGADGVARYPNGDTAPDTTVSRLLCDTTLRRILLDDHGIPLDVGRGVRLATHEQRLALAALYTTCGIPGCTVPFDQCEIHHITWWEHGGPTDLHNLLPECTRHHHLTHTGHLQLHLTADRQLIVIWNTDPLAEPPGQPGRPPPEAHAA